MANPPKMRGDFCVKSPYLKLSKEHVKRLLEITGDPDPELGAESQDCEHINQLGRWLATRLAWSCVHDADDTESLGRQASLEHFNPNSPFAGADLAIRQMLDKGVDPKAIIELVRTSQAEAFSTFFYRLGDPEHCEEFVDEPHLADLVFGIWQMDAETEQLHAFVGSLHEGFVSGDPTGRECCPPADMLPSR